MEMKGSHRTEVPGEIKILHNSGRLPLQYEQWHSS